MCGWTYYRGQPAGAAYMSDNPDASRLPMDASADDPIIQPSPSVPATVSPGLPTRRTKTCAVDPAD